MLIDPRVLQKSWRCSPKIVIHIGAHEAEELHSYAEAEWGSTLTVWLDALEEKVNLVSKKVESLENHTAIWAVLSDVDGQESYFNEASNGQSSSMLELGTHSTSYPEIVFTKKHKIITKRFDSIFDQFSPGSVLVNLDVQGFELPVLRGFGKLLNHVDYVYSEINTEQVYEGCTLFEDLKKFLADFDFECVDIRLTEFGWGDALFIKKSSLPRFTGIRRKYSQFLTSSFYLRSFARWREYFTNQT
jgi:FkbM family methyltransferase